MTTTELKKLIAKIEKDLTKAEKGAYELGTVAGTVRPIISQCAVAFRAKAFNEQLGKLG